jgi:hypothetical protein
VLAFSEGAVKEASLSFKKGWHSLKELSKVFAILEMCWHSLKELLKKKVLASLDMFWHLQKELLKSVGKLRKV